VQFCGTLQRVDGSYKICLERSQLGPSCRFTRRFGSKNFLRIRVPSTILHTADNHLINYFCRPFVLWGCIFRPFYAKDANIFLFKTNEVMDDTGISSTPSPTGMTFLDFIKWHNPPEFNTGQVSVYSLLQPCCAYSVISSDHDQVGCSICPWAVKFSPRPPSRPIQYFG
jgi:RNA-dependent RNA polymerase